MPRAHCSSAPGGELGGADVRTQNLLLNGVLSLQRFTCRAPGTMKVSPLPQGKGLSFGKSTYEAFSKGKTRMSGTGSFVFCLFLVALCTE